MEEAGAGTPRLFAHSLLGDLLAMREEERVGRGMPRLSLQSDDGLRFRFVRNNSYGVVCR